jgi:signal transduction histidine kinase
MLNARLFSRLRAKSGRPGAGPLVRRYFMTSFLLVSGGLLSSGLVQIYYSYAEALQQLALLQQEKADGAAFRIEQFFSSIEQGLRTAAKSRELVLTGISPDFRFEMSRLLNVLPPLMDLAAIPVDGREAVQVSRFKSVFLIQSDDQRYRKTILAFKSDSKLKMHISAVEFARDSEPHASVAVPIERYPGRLLGVLFADIDLRYVADVIGAVTIGKKGYAYVVTSGGNLIAHPDMSLVLGRANVGGHSQVELAFDKIPNDKSRESIRATNVRGEKVFSSFARIPGLDWAVIIEQPVAEINETIYAILLRTSGLILLGLGIASLASLYVAHHVVRPLAILSTGAQRIGLGDLDHRLEITTDDELEALAGEFNKMTDALKRSYSGLEQKVTERTEALQVANERLQELDRLKSHFLSNVSHELRTPLTAIGSLVDNMLDGVTGTLTDKQSRYISGIKDSSERLARLINDLLDLSVIESGRVRLEPSRFSLSDLVQQVGNTMTAVAAAKPVALELSVADGNYTAWADRDRINQVLTNLIGNAIKFTPQGGKISVDLGPATDDEWITVSVSDTGPGIPEDERARIFDEFYQIGRPGEEKIKGVGLGLAISKKLVEMNGGKISVESNRGTGSTFTFTVPAYRQDSTTAELHRGAQI